MARVHFRIDEDVHRARTREWLRDTLPLFLRASIAVLFVSLAGCASMPRPLACSPGEQLLVHDSLYFGTAKPNGVVTAAEWAEFLGNTVTPRFPQGLTAWQASGQWRGADGAIVNE